VPTASRRQREEQNGRQWGDDSSGRAPATPVVNRSGVVRNPALLALTGEPHLSPRWLSIREIAADLGVSASTAYKWSARGGPWFPRSIRLRNGDIRVRRDWYEQWLAEQESR